MAKVANSSKLKCLRRRVAPVHRIASVTYCVLKYVAQFTAHERGLENYF